MQDMIIFERNNLKLEFRENMEHLLLLWKGESIERYPGRFISPVLEQILTLNELKQKKIIMDFRQLQFMNSSTVTVIIRIIKRVKNGTGNILIIYSKDLHWQESVFSALFVFITDDQKVEIKGE